MSPSYRRAVPAGLLAAAACLVVPAAAPATTYDTSPREAAVLPGGARFVAQDGWNSLALYRGDGSVVHRFPAPARVKAVALSPSGEHLAAGCSDGSLLLWRVDSGERVWVRGPGETGLGYAWDVSFAGDGGRVAACGARGGAAVFDARTGRRVGGVDFPPGQTSVTSVALGPDGTGGFLVELGGRVHRFDLAGGGPVDTGLRGAGPVRYSADGRHVAFRSNDSGSSEQVAVVRADGPPGRQDVGAFAHVGLVRPAADGGFLVTARVGGRGDAGYVGARVRPEGGRAEEVWRLGADRGVSERTCWHPGRVVGVSTDFRLVTRVTDLRTGEAVLEVDNSANARPELVSAWRAGVGRDLVLAGLGAAAAAVLAAWALRRRRRHGAGPSTPSGSPSPAQ